MGGTPFSFFPMVSTHVWPKYPPSLIYNKSYPSTILVSSFKYFSLTFLSDLMKQLQYGCQPKPVNDFIMILLCFSISSFIQHFKYMFKIYKLCIECDTQSQLETISYTKLSFSTDLHRNECDHFVFISFSTVTKVMFFFMI